ncbi:MAG: hypothetical protein GKR89_23995 [Candidatus Latescibacteria bacterium]|nr:hypothetical protein [Candidatus Latescibacterota bacterium]
MFHRNWTRRLACVLFVAAIAATNGCSLIMPKVGMMVGGLLTQATADLSTVSAQVRFIRNLYPAETMTTEVKYVGPELWQQGSNTVVINFLKREGVGMYSIDGTVSVDGVELPHLANGVYALKLDAGDLAPKTFEISTSSGQRASFTVGPTDPIGIKSVNGQREGATVNLKEDLVLELDNPPGTGDSEIRVMLMGEIMGTRAWADVGIFKSADRLVIPQVAFMHPAGSLGPNMGPSYMLVERFAVAPSQVEGFGAAQIISSSWDCVPVNVEGDLDLGIVGQRANLGLTSRGDIESEQGNIKYEVSKPNAFLGRPFSTGKKFAVVSFTVRATKLSQSRTSSSSSTSSYGSYSVTTTTTTTETRQFPQLPEVFWDNLVEEMYADFEATLTNNWDVELIPVERALQAPSYAGLEPIDDGITTVEVEKSYKGTKNLIPTTLGALMGSISSTFASDRIDARLIRELGVDGIIAVTVDLEMPWDEFTLSPRMSYRISGPPNGYVVGPTIYGQGVVSGPGVPLDEAKLQADDILDVLATIVRQDELIAAFAASLSYLQQEEVKQGYEEIWALK